MVTAACLGTVDANGKSDLFVAVDWGVPLIVSLSGKEVTTKPIGSRQLSGWWSALTSVDIDGDGDLDVVAGNHGLNSRFRGSVAEPVSMIVNDFDGNGYPEQIVSRYIEGKSYPLTLRHDLLSQVPALKKQFLKYDSYYNLSVADIFSEAQLRAGFSYEATQLGSGWFRNEGAGRFTFEALGEAAQVSPVFATAAINVPGIGTGVLLGGNLDMVKPEAGAYDASDGAVVYYQGEGMVTAPSRNLGIELIGEVRALHTITIVGEPWLIVGRNSAAPAFYRPISKPL